jgi:hypothetical protein
MHVSNQAAELAAAEAELMGQAVPTDAAAVAAAVAAAASVGGAGTAGAAPLEHTVPWKLIAGEACVRVTVPCEVGSAPT